MFKMFAYRRSNKMKFKVNFFFCFWKLYFIWNIFQLWIKVFKTFVTGMSLLHLEFTLYPLTYNRKLGLEF